ncbi:histidine kinase [Aestuariivirga litoralis]|uniref:Blue-light-activated histidine kinase n=1 Tax=Aestuariivirga litoralis TaxID=2650924 RepID=A0A2W2BK77_9HYPH|nr:histidine kinase [Aestuariivirga litoralis]
MIGTAVVMRLLFPLAGPFLSFYPAILFCALIGGHRMGIAALLTGLAVSPFFFRPGHDPVPLVWDVASWFSFALFGYLIVKAIDFQQRTLVTSRQLTESLQSQQHFSGSVIAAAPSLTYIYDIETGHNLFISPQSKSILGYEPQEISAMGPGLMATLLHPDDVPRAMARFAAMRASPEVTSPDIEYRMRRKDGSWVWLLSSDRAFSRDAGGRLRQVLGVATDITARKRFEEQLLASEERFRGIFENAPTGISISDIDGNFVQCNPAYERILGYSLDELRNVPFVSIVHPDDRDANLREMERLVRQEVPYFEIFNRSIHKTGRTVWVHKFVLLLRDRQGTPVSIVALVTDMTERKRQEEQIKLLMREVNHRSKNLLAVVQSVARQTASYGDPARFAERFSDRLQGLAASHDLLVNNAWRGVELGELVSSQLAHFKDLVGRRIMVAGPPLRINASAAQSLGMALHELAANAGKYGALSREDGRVAVSWEVTEDGRRLLVTWREEGGPPVAPPERSGLGTLILTRLAEQSLEAEAALDHAPQGLVWRLSAPLAKVVEAGGDVSL